MRPIRLFSIAFLALASTGCIRWFDTGGGEDLDTVLARWRAEAVEPNVACHLRGVADCNNANVVFTREVGFDSGQTKFYNAETGRHLGSSDWWAFLKATHPVQIICPSGVVTESLCGPQEVGDTVRP